jgi:hypothetical protein
VIGVSLTDTRRDRTAREFTALGTAIRSRGACRPASPFTTDLGGADVAKLMQSGWVPVSLVYGISMGIRHDDAQTRRQRRAWFDNTEMAGYTDLIERVRADARTQFLREVARSGADAALLSGASASMWEADRDEHRDHAAECVMTGTAIARFPRTTAGFGPPTLSILPLRAAGKEQRR